MTEFHYIKNYLVLTSLSTTGVLSLYSCITVLNLQGFWLPKLKSSSFTRRFFTNNLHPFLKYIFLWFSYLKISDIMHLLIVHSSKFPWYSPTSEKVSFLNKRRSNQFKEKFMLLQYPCALTIIHINAVFLKKTILYHSYSYFMYLKHVLVHGKWLNSSSHSSIPVFDVVLNWNMPNSILIQKSELSTAACTPNVYYKLINWFT